MLHGVDRSLELCAAADAWSIVILVGLHCGPVTEFFIPIHPSYFDRNVSKFFLFVPFFLNFGAVQDQHD